jgi:hypothetical protein
MKRALLIVIRIIYGGLAALLLTAAVLQWNDPDPWLWVIVYGLAGGLCVWPVFDRSISPPILLLLTASMLGYAAYLGMLYASGQAATPMYATTLPADPTWLDIEELREMVGLVIVSLIVLSQWPWRHFRKRASGHAQNAPAA